MTAPSGVDLRVNRRWLRNGGGGLALMMLGGLVALWGASLAAHRVFVCERLFGLVPERTTGALSFRCTAPTLLVGLAMTLAMIGGLYVAFGFALWNYERVSRSGPNNQRP